MRKRRSRMTGWASALAAGLASAPALALAQMPVPPTGPAPAPMQMAQPVGPLRGFCRHVSCVLKDQFIGYPDEFAEAPIGFYVAENFGAMKSRAAMHNFILYRSDFMEGETALSPYGAQKLTTMAARLPCWMGPIYVEWTPDKPGLADQRKTALVALLQKTGLPVVSERVVVGPSPYPGMIGADANNAYQNLILRDQLAPLNYSYTPTSTSNFGSGAR
jgi:hypothetical protein